MLVFWICRDATAIGFVSGFAARRVVASDHRLQNDRLRRNSRAEGFGRVIYSSTMLEGVSGMSVKIGNWRWQNKGSC